MTRGQPETASHRARHGPHQLAALARRLAASALIVWASVAGSKPSPAAVGGVVSYADGEPFTVIRRDSLMSGSKGVALVAGDLVATGSNAFLVVQAPDGTLIGVGPTTEVFFADRGEVATLFVLKGWVKADTKAAPIRIVGTRLGLQGHQAVMLLYVDERSGAAYDEQGAVTVLVPDAAGAPVVREPGPNHFFSREDRFDLLSQPSPSADFVKKMPVAFRDPLPAFPTLPEPVPPQRLRAVNFADIQNWLTMPREWRSGFVERFRGRLKDPAFFAAMDAHQAQLPEWAPILHPSPASDSDRTHDAPQAKAKPAPHKAQSQQGDESR